MTIEAVITAAKARGYTTANRAFADRSRERPGRYNVERWTVVDHGFTPIASVTVTRTGRVTFRKLGSRP